MRVIQINPGQDYPSIVHYDSAEEVRRAVGGEAEKALFGQYTILCSAPMATPNRLLDGRLLCGPIIISRAGGLSLDEARALREECARWKRPKWKVANA